MQRSPYFYLYSLKSYKGKHEFFTIEKKLGKRYWRVSLRNTQKCFMPQCQTAWKQWLTIPEVISSVDIFVWAKNIILYTLNQDVPKVIPYFWQRSYILNLFALKHPVLFFDHIIHTCHHFKYVNLGISFLLLKQKTKKQNKKITKLIGLQLPIQMTSLVTRDSIQS